jgi:N-acetylneuraminic acid mutarotase
VDPAAEIAAWRPGAFATEWTGTELLVWSGGSNHQGAVPAYTDGAAYNPATRAWRSLPVAPVPARYGAAHVWTGTEMLVWGGEECGCPRPVADGGGAAYNPATNQWRKLAPAPLRGVRVAAAVWNGQEMFVLRGGTAGKVAVAAYNPSSDSWRSMPVLSASDRVVGDADIAAFANGQVLLGLTTDAPLTAFVYPAGA